MKNNYKMTMYACFIGYIVQAVVNSFVPLLFVTFHIPLTQITLLITVNFVIQLVVDLLSAGFVVHTFFCCVWNIALEDSCPNLGDFAGS